MRKLINIKGKKLAFGKFLLKTKACFLKPFKKLLKTEGKNSKL